MPLPGPQEPSPEVEDVGAGQGLQPVVPLADGLPAQATVEFGLLHTLVEAHHVGTQLPLQPLAVIDALAQTVQLQLTQLGQRGQEMGRGDETKSVLASSCPASLPRGHQAVRLYRVQSWAHSCLADGPKKNVLPSLGLAVSSCRMRGC